MKVTINGVIDDYIASFPLATQKLLKQIRQVIAKAAPMASGSIKYAMPTFEYLGNLVHFAAYKITSVFTLHLAFCVLFNKKLMPTQTLKEQCNFP